MSSDGQSAADQTGSKVTKSMFSYNAFMIMILLNILIILEEYNPLDPT